MSERQNCSRAHWVAMKTMDQTPMETETTGTTGTETTETNGHDDHGHGDKDDHGDYR